MKSIHGIQLRFGTGKNSMELLSYAVFSRGILQVDHKTTARLRKEGQNLLQLSNLEALRSDLPII